MNIFGINGGELIVLIVLALMLLGPDKIPQYLRTLRDWIHKARVFAAEPKNSSKKKPVRTLMKSIGKNMILANTIRAASSAKPSQNPSKNWNRRYTRQKILSKTPRIRQQTHR